MINTFRGSGVEIFGEDILAYYSLDGTSEWAWARASFVAFVGIAYLGLVFTLRLHQRR